YCSYCERRMSTSLAVEHVLPKSIYPDLETEWANFLLACVNCNSVKGSTDIKREDHIWPDNDNTFLAFVYAKGGFVYLADDLNAEQRSKAQALLDLVGLQRHQAANWPDPRDRDQRWRQRDEVWAVAEIFRARFEALDQVDAVRELVLEAAQGYGFFSVWMTVFEDYPTIRAGLIQLFAGTAPSCFTPNGKPINRPGRVI
ncbi:HNH endonuclease, partial [Leptolyngbya cf. ectocarpi LEGE 11479]